MRVLHLLSQRPLLTGSGVTLDAICRRAAKAGVVQRVIVCAPAGADVDVGGLPASDIDALRFETAALPFCVPGMSDVMPYPSSRFSKLEPDQLARYRRELSDHITTAVDAFGPDVIHAHHLWLMSSMLGELAPGVPAVAHCHGTGLRQLELCPHLAAGVVEGLSGIAHVAALTDAAAADIEQRVGVSADRITVVGAGFRDDRFSAGGRSARPGHVAYAGKLSDAKGVAPLCDAVDQLAARRPITLHVAGAGAGSEADAIAARIDASANTRAHGRLDQTALADLLRQVDVFVLPSLYEGLPLVLVEAYASGCRLVATDLPGTRQLRRVLGDALELVPRPRTDGPDRPIASELPAFVADLESALERAVDAGPITPDPAVLRSLTWDAVYERVEAIWRRLAGRAPR